ncbi:MAG: FAD:protein FMN transferase, partial [Candidatus Omnitrophota bacterium]|nr:FAD:protein FMN transferase [Candidatus Omnitrophota bacterium]
ELENMLSIFEKSSVVSQINNNNDKKVLKVPPELFRLLKRSGEYYALTQKAFDITVCPFVELWGFGANKNNPPEPAAVRETLSHVGFDKIKLSEQDFTVTFDSPGMRIDFGGLAKGYAVDEASRILKESGIKSGIVNMGGDLYCIGAGPDNRSWSIGIRDPDHKNEILAVLKIRNKAIATSGDYENFYIYDGKTRAHIIDPRTGYTVSNNLRSVTIIADDCAAADAFATAIFVMGENKGLEAVEKLPGIECFLIIENGSEAKVVMSSGMKKYLKENET